MRQAQFFYHNKNAPKPNRPNHIGTSVLIEYRDKLLLEHRTDSETWAIIGGGLKTEESLAECAVREVYEETGIKLRENMLELYGIYDDPSRIASYPDGNVLRVITVVYKVYLARSRFFAPIFCATIGVNAIAKEKAGSIVKPFSLFALPYPAEASTPILFARDNNIIKDICTIES